MFQKVFISYSSVNKETATAICDAVEAAGVKCWIAPRDIAVGATWAGSIIQALNTCDVMVLVFSQAAQESPQVQREMERAASKGLPIVTVRIENIVPDEQMEYYLSHSHWLDAYGKPLTEALPLLTEALLNSEAGLGLLKPELQHDQRDADLETELLDDINWRVTDLQELKEPLTSAAIDEVLEGILNKAQPLRERERTASCDKIYRKLANGVLEYLDSRPPSQRRQWARPIQLLQKSLHQALTEAPDARQETWKTLHRLMSDFVDRIDSTRSERMARPVTWVWTLSLILLSVGSLYFSYGTGNKTWDLVYAYPFGPPATSAWVGPYLEFARSVVLLFMAIYWLETTFRDEYQQLFLDLSIESWKQPRVAAFRIFTLAMLTSMTWAVSAYILKTGPRNLSSTAQELYERMMEPGSKYSAEDAMAVKAESVPNYPGHIAPYSRYLPYAWTNYVGFGLPLLVVTLFSVVGDAGQLLEERQGLFQTMSKPRARDEDIDRAFTKFFNICFQHTQRYITVLAWISGGFAFEVLVSRKTLAPTGLMYEFLCSLVVGASTLIWVGLLIHFYEGAFQRCCTEKRRRNSLTDQWEDSRRTLKFLFKSFFNHAGGIFALLYIVPFLSYFGPWRA